MNTTDVEVRLATALRRDSDATPPPAAPSCAQLRALATGHPPVKRAPRIGSARWQHGLLAAAAAVLVAAGASGYLALHRSQDPGPSRALNQGQSISANQFLLVSARTVLAGPFTAPRPDQVDYARTVGLRFVEARAADGHRIVRLGAGLTTTEVWSPQTLGRAGLIRYDHREQIPYVVPTDGDPLYLANYAALSRLPTTDSERLLAEIATNVGNARHPGDTTTVDAFKVMVNGGLFEQVLPPGLSAAVYTALAADRAVTARSGAVDVLGRPAVAVGVTDTRGARWEVLFDARTHEPIGTRTYPMAYGPTPRPSYLAGNVDYSSTAIVKVATVDRNGQTPSH